MFLREVASEIVLANLILASASLAKEPIGLNGMAAPPFRWQTPREEIFELWIALYPAGRFQTLAPIALLVTDSFLDSWLPARSLCCPSSFLFSPFPLPAWLSNSALAF